MGTRAERDQREGALTQSAGSAGEGEPIEEPNDTRLTRLATAGSQP